MYTHTRLSEPPLHTLVQATLLKIWPVLMNVYLLNSRYTTIGSLIKSQYLITVLLPFTIPSSFLLSALQSCLHIVLCFTFLSSHHPYLPFISSTQISYSPCFHSKTCFCIIWALLLYRCLNDFLVALSKTAVQYILPCRYLWYTHSIKHTPSHLFHRFFTAVHSWWDWSESAGVLLPFSHLPPSPGGSSWAQYCSRPADQGKLTVVHNVCVLGTSNIGTSSHRHWEPLLYMKSWCLVTWPSYSQQSMNRNRGIPSYWTLLELRGEYSMQLWSF